jgi:hypothetical protein
MRNKRNKAPRTAQLIARATDLKEAVRPAKTIQAKEIHISALNGGMFSVSVFNDRGGVINDTGWIKAVACEDLGYIHDAVYLSAIFDAYLTEDPEYLAVDFFAGTNTMKIYALAPKSNASEISKPSEMETYFEIVGEKTVEYMPTAGLIMIT